MKKLLALFTILMTLVAVAGGPVNVKQINITNLSEHNGKYVTAFYVSARASGFSFPSTRPRVKEVLKKSTPIRISNGKVSLPRTTIIESGFTVFNYIKVVVHSSNKKILIKNIDGSIPSGQDISGSRDFSSIKSFFIKRSSLGSLSSPAPINIQAR